MTLSLLWRERQICKGGACFVPLHPHFHLSHLRLFSTTRVKGKVSQLVSLSEAWSWWKLGYGLTALPKQPPAARGSHLAGSNVTVVTTGSGVTDSPVLDCAQCIFKCEVSSFSRAPQGLCLTQHGSFRHKSLCDRRGLTHWERPFFSSGAIILGEHGTDISLQITKSENSFCTSRQKAASALTRTTDWEEV